MCTLFTCPNATTAYCLGYMKMNMTMSRGYILIIFAVAIISLCFWSYAQAVGTTISACVEGDGALYIIGQGLSKTKCARHDTPLSWNITGLQGPKGDTGATGAVGPQGQAGSTGSQGPVGPQGPMGPQGPSGSSGQALDLLDANGQDLGVFLGRNATDYEAYIPSLDVTVQLDPHDYDETVSIIPLYGGSPLYMSTDCTGTAYYQNGGGEGFIADIAVLPSGTHYYTQLPVPAATQGISSFANGAGSCSAEGGAPNLQTVYTLKEITLPFTVPIAWPLHVAEK